MLIMKLSSESGVSGELGYGLSDCSSSEKLYMSIQEGYQQNYAKFYWGQWTK